MENLTESDTGNTSPLSTAAILHSSAGTTRLTLSSRVAAAISMDGMRVSLLPKGPRTPARADRNPADRSGREGTRGRPRDRTAVSGRLARSFPPVRSPAGEIRRSQNFVWYDVSGKMFTRVRAAHYRRGIALFDVSPPPTTTSSGGAALSAEAFATYIDAFNRDDVATFGEFYAPDVTLVIAGKHELVGRQSIIEFYKLVKAQTPRTIQVNRVISTPEAVAAELQSEFTALQDLPEFIGGPMKKGDRLFINTVVLYDVRDGRFNRIRSAELRKIHRASPRGASRGGQVSSGSICRRQRLL